MKSQEGFVLDASVAMAWFFADERNAYADAVRLGITQSQVSVPTLWPLEVANITVVGEWRNHATPAQAASWFGLLTLLPIIVDDETTARAWGETVGLARAQSLSVYDAAYLELAMRRGLP